MNAIRQWKKLVPGAEIIFVGLGDKEYRYQIVSKDYKMRSMTVAYELPNGRRGETVLKSVPHWLEVGAILYVPKDARVMDRRR